MSFFSSFFSAIHNDEAASKHEEQADATTSHEKQPAEEAPEQKEEAEEEPAAEEEEEEEPEDLLPSIREKCQESKSCATFAKHFEHCQEKVNSGEGFKGEDCVEELCKFST
ncbi:hypothetical protein FRC02_009253 [Tulasnella sp. 418]|nr:hypothetical protein FRC02_009253 [Tulasnella sp. 418]